VFDAIVLAGGRASRLGGIDKPQLTIGGRTLLDRVVDAVSDATRIVVVGPAQPVSRDVVFCQEQPPGAGPVAALAAAAARTAADAVVVLAADLPAIRPAVPALLAALPDSGAVLLVDGTGRRNYLAAAWRRVDLINALAALGDPTGAAMRALTEHVDVVEVRDSAGWGRDCDTWDDVEQARDRLEDRP
jgi:molybdopterin-guanine dinucleotide biosynthesis protein A